MEMLQFCEIYIQQVQYEHTYLVNMDWGLYKQLYMITLRPPEIFNE